MLSTSDPKYSEVVLVESSTGQALVRVGDLRKFAAQGRKAKAAAPYSSHQEPRPTRPLPIRNSEAPRRLPSPNLRPTKRSRGDDWYGEDGEDVFGGYEVVSDGDDSMGDPRNTRLWKMPAEVPFDANVEPRNRQHGYRRDDGPRITHQQPGLSRVVSHTSTSPSAVLTSRIFAQHVPPSARSLKHSANNRGELSLPSSRSRNREVSVRLQPSPFIHQNDVGPSDMPSSPPVAGPSRLWASHRNAAAGPSFAF